jgi:hypothetical protein
MQLLRNRVRQFYRNQHGNMLAGTQQWGKGRSSDNDNPAPRGHLLDPPVQFPPAAPQSPSLGTNR